MYGWANDATISRAEVVAADQTNPRKDLVYVQINDSSAGDGSGGLSAEVLYLAGTPGVTPSAPALPARSFEVGVINVPVSGGGSPTVTLNPARFVSAGAVLPVESQAKQDALTHYPASEIVRTDDKYKRYISDGSKWVPHADALGLVHHEIVTVSSGFIDVNLAVIKHIPSFDFKAGRKYRIIWDFEYQGNTAGNYITALIGTCLTTDASGSTAGITQRNGRPFKVHDSNIDSSGRVEAIYVPPSDLTRQIKFLLQVTTGTGLARISAENLEPVNYMIEDLGAQF
jgi:hypothetical protein